MILRGFCEEITLIDFGLGGNYLAVTAFVMKAKHLIWPVLLLKDGLLSWRDVRGVWECPLLHTSAII